MGRPWVEHESWELVDEASEVAERDVGRLLLDADADELKDTRNAQLTTFVSSLMVLDAAERLGLEPSFCAGHSLGEYTALTATGALGFDEGVRLVCERADAMHQAGIENPGTMAAVLGLDDDEVEVACRRADSDVWVANFNAPGQVVIAGSSEGVAAAGFVAKQLGAKKVMPLPVSGAFHTPFMAPARDRLRKAIAEANPRDTEVPVISNVDALAHNTGADWSSLLSAQLSSPVRWKHCLLTGRRSASPSSSSSGPAACSPAWPSAPSSRPEPSPCPHRKTSRSCSSGSMPVRRGAAPSSRVSTCSPTNASSSARPPGVFTPIADLSDGTMLTVGSVLGHVGDTEVRSPFAGVLQSYIAVDGERVTMRQPIAWLRTD